MKVLLVNGSSRPSGCTSVALHEAASALGRANGVPHPENVKVLTNFIR